MFEIADRYVEDRCELSPSLATFIGVGNQDHTWGDTGLDSVEASAELARRYEAKFADHVDEPEFLDRLAANVTLGSLGEQLESHEAGDHFRDLRHLGSTARRSLGAQFDLREFHASVIGHGTMRLDLLRKVSRHILTSR